MTGLVYPAFAVPGYVEVGALSRLLGVERAAIRRRLREEGMALFIYPGDQRLRMARLEDVRTLMKFRKAPERKTERT
jgi:hypothetical protein